MEFRQVVAQPDFAAQPASPGASDSSGLEQLLAADGDEGAGINHLLTCSATCSAVCPSSMVHVPGPGMLVASTGRSPPPHTCKQVPILRLVDLW